jgi:1-acyl-sn-glycerol-3-phosphate acyltransferase
LDRSGTLYFKLSKYFSSGILVICRIKLKITGLENFNHKNVYVFVSNHSSQFDIPALQAAIPNRASIIYKKELEKIPLFGWQLKYGPYIGIERKNPEKALKSIEEAKLKMEKKGMSALVFAEGTRSKSGEVQPFKRGAFYLASRVGHPIIPVSLSGTGKILPKGKFRINKGDIQVHFDKPIETSAAISRKEELELMEKVRDIIIKNIRK